MAFQKGNTLAAKPRLFDAALRKAIAQDNGKKVRECADKLLELAAAGEPWAVNLLADRLDGKASQQVDLSISDSRAEEMNDNDLLRIAAASRDRTSEAASGPQEPSSVH